MGRNIWFIHVANEQKWCLQFPNDVSSSSPLKCININFLWTIDIYNGTDTSYTATALEPLTFYRFKLLGNLGGNITTSQISVFATSGRIKSVAGKTNSSGIGQPIDAQGENAQFWAPRGMYFNPKTGLLLVCGMLQFLRDIHLTLI